MRLLVVLALIAGASVLISCGSSETATVASTREVARSPAATATPVPGVRVASGFWPDWTPSPTVSPTPVPIYHPPPYTVAIEPGHGGLYYWGGSARDSDGRLWIEKDVALAVGLRLQILLAERGYNTFMVRSGDYTLTDFLAADYRPSLIAEAQARVDAANEVRADALVSVHFNGWLDGSQSGAETYCNPDRSFGQESCALAFYVQDALVRHIREAGYDVTDRGVKNDGEVNGDPQNPHSFLLGTNANFRPSLMPGVIVETLFLSSAADLEFLRRDNAIEVIAAAYAEGIDAYFRWLNGA